MTRSSQGIEPPSDPERFNGPHRLTSTLHQAQMDANESQKNAACSQTGDYATTGLPYTLQPKTGQDCDEYPFRSTLEGAASPDWDFSVRAVDSTQNRSAGGSLSALGSSRRPRSQQPAAT
ncbi:NucA/NucB deoxyribonuclease domain-containing protein [Streptomyces sp. NPDC002788]